ncbi:unnamed protein product [Notodromas monacha]|uniref:Uncharacterized protein n=1 Tax=Notodromas monacha TaxID=399045 RepID=A0A7R9BRC7_9CRUS|nr:unnamed protein product [Notodromas monacha]CAG0919202.1 unnamed protein product [Notodromas monacha]
MQYSSVFAIFIRGYYARLLSSLLEAFAPGVQTQESLGTWVTQITSPVFTRQLSTVASCLRNYQYPVFSTCADALTSGSQRWSNGYKCVVSKNNEIIAAQQSTTKSTVATTTTTKATSPATNPQTSTPMTVSTTKTAVTSTASTSPSSTTKTNAVTSSSSTASSTTTTTTTSKAAATTATSHQQTVNNKPIIIIIITLHYKSINWDIYHNKQASNNRTNTDHHNNNNHIYPNFPNTNNYYYYYFNTYKYHFNYNQAHNYQFYHNHSINNNNNKFTNIPNYTIIIIINKLNFKQQNNYCPTGGNSSPGKTFYCFWENQTLSEVKTVACLVSPKKTECKSCIQSLGKWVRQITSPVFTRQLSTVASCLGYYQYGIFSTCAAALMSLGKWVTQITSPVFTRQLSTVASCLRNYQYGVFRICATALTSGSQRWSNGYKCMVSKNNEIIAAQQSTTKSTVATSPATNPQTFTPTTEEIPRSSLILETINSVFPDDEEETFIGFLSCFLLNKQCVPGKPKMTPFSISFFPRRQKFRNEDSLTKGKSRTRAAHPPPPLPPQPPPPPPPPPPGPGRMMLMGTKFQQKYPNSVTQGLKNQVPIRVPKGYQSGCCLLPQHHHTRATMEPPPRGQPSRCPLWGELPTRDLMAYRAEPRAALLINAPFRRPLADYMAKRLGSTQHRGRRHSRSYIAPKTIFAVTTGKTFEGKQSVEYPHTDLGRCDHQPPELQPSIVL